MAIRVAINGFGRIGRLALRKMVDDNDFDVVAINSTATPQNTAHLLKYDTMHGRFDGHEVTFNDNELVIDGKVIRLHSTRDANELDWAKDNVDIVLECTGQLNDAQKALVHINNGAKKVVLSAPGKGDLKTIVYNVNHDVLDGSEKVVSAASCTTNCLAPLAQAIDNAYGIVNGFMTTVHAYTHDQNTLDGNHKKGDMRRARAAAENIVPNTTGAAKALGLVIPHLEGKLDGSAQRVPVADGSLTELVTIVKKAATVEEVNAAMKAVANETFGYNEDPIVSSDIVGISYGSLFDATQTKVMALPNGGALVKVVSWYDNEMSYTVQMLRTMKHLGSFL